MCVLVKSSTLPTFSNVTNFKEDLIATKDALGPFTKYVMQKNDFLDPFPPCYAFCLKILLFCLIFYKILDSP